MSKLHTGRCLCGAVKLEVTGEPLWKAHCHCESCRRSTGSALATFVGLPHEAVRFVEGTPKVYVSSPGVERLFCGTCGAPMAYQAARWPDEIHLHISVLDDPEAFPPTAHVYTAEKLSWLHLDDGLKQFDQLGVSGSTGAGGG